jgi:HAD superfamily hydrolase (TIGR01490 family)
MSERRRVAAFFDLDGTVIAPPSLEFRFAVFLARRHELRLSAAFRWLGAFLKKGVKAVHENKNYLSGVREGSAREWAEENFYSMECYADALWRIAWHREQGHSVFFVSGTLAPQARAAANHIAREGEIGVAATELQSFAGRWTGCVAGVAICGAAKAHSIRELAARHDIDLARSYVYGNSLADRWMLACVGNATVVNPGTRLKWLALRRGWRIAHWPRLEPGLEIPPDSAEQEFAPLRRL